MTKTFKEIQQAKAREATASHCYKSYGDILNKDTIDKTIEYWGERLSFIGTSKQWNSVHVLENQLMNSV